ncbi:nitroreductase family protein [Desulfovibrio sp. OttesenSCG-928-O18]|nr:nitroreductase family protein [Desulfovibrio sp. OttesenSCG-928-O18]
MKHAIIFVLILVCAASGAFFACEAQAAGGEKRLILPKPQTTGGKPLMEALAARSASRSFSDKPVSEQVLSNLLWATWGVNRSDGRRTAPTARNTQDIQVYAALESGVWRYDAVKNELVLALEEDTRKKFGGAPLTLLFAVPEKDRFGSMHAGSLYQNAGLFCASEGLANVVKASGTDALKGVLPLPSGYIVVIIQSIGWPR